MTAMAAMADRDRGAAAQAGPRTNPSGTEPILSVRDLVVEFGSGPAALRAVDGVSFDLYPGETLGIVGESGSGKSVTVMSMLGLLARPAGRVQSGSVIFDGEDLLRMPRRRLRRVRGGEIGMVFQDPMTSLNPVMRVGQQITETLREHQPSMRADQARSRAIELLSTVGVPNPEVRIQQYPHEYSGGMRQRALIALAMANTPRVLIADEPTTALDVTIQAQVLDALELAQRETGAARIIITHDLGVIAEIADRVVVMYAGRAVESGDVQTIFSAPRHPYTLGLLTSLPRLQSDADRLTPIPGQPPSPRSLPGGCAFHPRCALTAGRERCTTDRPELEPSDSGTLSACHFSSEMGGAVLEASTKFGINTLGAGT